MTEAKQNMIRHFEEVINCMTGEGLEPNYFITFANTDTSDVAYMSASETEPMDEDIDTMCEGLERNKDFDEFFPNGEVRTIVITMAEYQIMKAKCEAM